MKSVIRAILFSVFVLAGLALPMRAEAQDAGAIAEAIPVEVAEVVSGGTWSDGGVNGLYRALVVIPSSSGVQAHVFVQLVALQKDAAGAKVVKTIPVKEISEQIFSTAFLAMDAETENEMTLIVTAYGSGTDQDTTMQFKFDGQGNYKSFAGPGEETPAERPRRPKTDAGGVDFLGVLRFRAGICARKRRGRHESSCAPALPSYIDVVMTALSKILNAVSFLRPDGDGV
ncbi:MAG: hypothetical protein HC850_14870 [Rhodomicrobium sp.]|nr:hypothetical protein [Rhodomicrobium sp.]